LRAAGVDILVSLLQTEEAAELGLSREGAECSAAGMEFVSVPVADRGVPLDHREFTAAAEKLSTSVTTGKRVAVHCRQSVGRAGLLVTAIVLLVGKQPLRESILAVSRARGCNVPETQEQLLWLERFARNIGESRPPNSG